MDTATIIFQQLGGNKIIAMTGATHFAKDEYSLRFKFKGSQKSNCVKITLNSMDLYDVEYFKIRGANFKKVTESKGIYYDMLVKDFESTTGLYLSL